MKRQKDDERIVYQSLAMITQFGLNMIVPICLMSVLGIWLDRKLETSFFTIVLFAVGAVAGGQNIYRIAKKMCSAEEPRTAEKTHSAQESRTAEKTHSEQEPRTAEKTHSAQEARIAEETRSGDEMRGEGGQDPEGGSAVKAKAVSVAGNEDNGDE